MGLGNLVGALLSGVVAIPGGLIGSGVGALTGPFVKVKDAMSGSGEEAADEDKKEASEDAKVLSDEQSDETAHLAIVEAARELDGHQQPDASSGR